MAERICAVKIWEEGGMRWISAYTARKKNRKLAWAIEIGGLDKQEVREKVLAQERARLAKSVPQGGLT